MAALNPYSKPREIKTIRDFLRAGAPCPHKKNAVNQMFPRTVLIDVGIELSASVAEILLENPYCLLVGE